MQKTIQKILCAISIFIMSSVQTKANAQISEDLFIGYPLLQEKLAILQNLATEAAELEFFSVVNVAEKNPASSQCKDISAEKALNYMKRLFNSVCEAVSTPEKSIHMDNDVTAQLAQWVGTDDYRFCFGSVSYDYSRSEYASFKKKGAKLWTEFEVGIED